MAATSYDIATFSNRLALGYDDMAKFQTFILSIVSGSSSKFTSITLGTASDTGVVSGLMADGASAVAITLSSPAYTTDGAKILSIKNDTAEKVSVSKDGGITAAGTVTAGNLTTAGTVTSATETVSGTVTAGNLTTAGTVTAATGSISGTITAGTVAATTLTASTATISAGTVTADLISNAALGTLASGTGISTVYTNRNNGFIHKVTMSYVPVQAAALTKDITLYTLPAKCRIYSIVWDCTQTFTGTSISSCTLAVGTAAGGAQLLTAQSILSGLSTRGILSSEAGASLNTANGYVSWAGGGIVNLRFTSVGANLSALSTGSVTFYIEGVVYP